MIAYTKDKAGKVSVSEKITVQIDRTKPTIASLKCDPEDSNKIKMTASGASDGNGSGLSEYMYFVDNKAGKNDTILRKTVGTDSNPHVASYTATMGRYLGQVAVADKAGNVSNVQR